MFGNMLGKLQEAKQQMEEMKEKLEQISVKGSAGNEGVVIIMSASKNVKEVKVSDELFNNGEKEELEDLLVLALQDATTKADQIAAKEGKDALGGIMPNIPGLNF